MAEVAVTKKPAAETRPSVGFPSWEISPYTLMKRFSEELDRLFNHQGIAPFQIGDWAPAVEVEQKAGQLCVRAELPGMKKDDIKVEVTEEGLVVQGERKYESEKKKDGYFRSERAYGKFYRVIDIPEGANIEKARAEYANGVLEVTIPVPESKKQKREIPVQTAA